MPAGLFGPSGEALVINSELRAVLDRLGPPAPGRRAGALTEILQRSDRLDSGATTLNVGGAVYCLHLALLPGSDPPVRLLRLTSQDATPFGAMMSRLDLGFWDFDVAADRFTVSDAWSRMRGLPNRVVVEGNQYSWAEAIHPEDRDRLLALFTTQLSGARPQYDVIYRHRHPDLGWVRLACRAAVVDVAEDGKPRRIVGVDQVVSDDDAQARDHEITANKLNLAINLAGLGVWEYDEADHSVYWDDRMLDIYGLPEGANALAGDYWDDVLHPEDRDAVLAHAEQCRVSGDDMQIEYRIVRPSGEVRYIRSHARYIGSQATGRKLIGVNVDITDERRRAEALDAARRKMEIDALHDDLTGLGNRRALDKYCRDTLSCLGPDDRFSLMLLDLDRFKAVNDTLGHEVGDAVLRRVAGRLRHLAGPHGALFRLGGDEFAFLSTSITEQSVLDWLCDEILRALPEDMALREGSCSVGVSIGHTIETGPARDIKLAFRRADTALYRSKEAGRGMASGAADATPAAPTDQPP